MDTDMTSTDPQHQPPPPPPRPLLRPHDGRLVAGVAAGLATHLGLPLLLIRIGFVLATFFGGLGIVAYLACWLLIRDEREPDSLAQRMVANIRSGPAWLGVGLIVVAVAVILDRVTYLSGTFLWATVLLVGGVLLYRGDLGRPSSAPGERAAPAPAPALPATQEAPDQAPPPPPPHAPQPPPVPGPPPGPPESPAPRSILGRLTIGVALLALGLLAVADNLLPVLDPQPRHYMALATVVIGAGLLVGAWIGRARWMILLGILLIPPLVVSPAAELDWPRTLDARVVTPATVDGIGGPYETAAARWVFNLTEIPWEGDSGFLEVDLAVGEIMVVVPPDLAVTGSLDLGAGELITPGEARGGVGGVDTILDLPGSIGAIDLDVSVGAGRIEVVRADELDGFGRQFSSFGDVALAPVDLDQFDDVAVRVGNVQLDLTGLELADHAYRQISVGAGNIDVIVPADMNVVVHGNAVLGSVDLFGSRQGGFRVGNWGERIFDDEHYLELGLNVGTGNITVTERNS